MRAPRRLLMLALVGSTAVAAPPAGPPPAAALLGPALVRLSRLRQFTVDLRGAVTTGLFGLPNLGGARELRGSLGVDRSTPGALAFKAALSTRIGSQDMTLTVVRRGDALYFSAPLPIPGAGPGAALAFQIPMASLFPAAASPAPPGGDTGPAPAPPAALALLQQQLGDGSLQLQVDGSTLVLRRERPGDPRGPQQARLSFGPDQLPARLELEQGGQSLGALVLEGLREGPVDLDLPLPEERYQAAPTGGLAGLLAQRLAGGAAAMPTAPTPPAGPGKVSPFAALPAIPVPARPPAGAGAGLDLTGLAGMARNLGGAFSGMTAAPRAPGAPAGLDTTALRGLGDAVKALLQGTGAGGLRPPPGRTAIPGAAPVVAPEATPPVPGLRSPRLPSAAEVEWAREILRRHQQAQDAAREPADR